MSKYSRHQTNIVSLGVCVWVCFRCSGIAKLAAASVNIVSEYWSHRLGIRLYICQSMNAIAAS